MPLDSVFMLHDRYSIKALLGYGGMGAVYQALDTLTDQPCAVKEFRMQELSNVKSGKEGGKATDSSHQDSESTGITREKALRQFKREAKILATLDHPGLPKVTDYFGVEKEYYLVMTYYTIEKRILYKPFGFSPLPSYVKIGVFYDFFVAKVCILVH